MSQEMLSMLAAEGFQPLLFLLPSSLGLLEYILIVELAWLVAMAIYGYVLRRIVRNPRDSVVVFHRIFWRIFVYPKKTTLLEAYEKPRSVAMLDDFDAPMLDMPGSYDTGLGQPGAARNGDAAANTAANNVANNADTAGGTALGMGRGTSGGSHAGNAMAGVDVDVDVLGADFDALPPEPEPVSLDEAGEIEINVDMLPNAKNLAVQNMVGDTVTVTVPCGGEDAIANRYVVQLLCNVLQLESYQVTLMRGHARTSKTFRLTGISLQLAQQRVMAVSR